MNTPTMYERHLYVAIPNDSREHPPGDVHVHDSVGYRTTSLWQAAGDEYQSIWNEPSRLGEHGIRHYMTRVPHQEQPRYSQFRTHHYFNNHTAAALLMRECPNDLMARLFSTFVLGICVSKDSAYRPSQGITATTLFRSLLRLGRTSLTMDQCHTMHEMLRPALKVFDKVAGHAVVEFKAQGDVLVVRYQ